RSPRSRHPRSAGSGAQPRARRLPVVHRASGGRARPLAACAERRGARREARDRAPAPELTSLQPPPLGLEPLDAAPEPVELFPHFREVPALGADESSRSSSDVAVEDRDDQVVTLSRQGSDLEERTRIPPADGPTTPSRSIPIPEADRLSPDFRAGRGE